MNFRQPQQPQQPEQPQGQSQTQPSLQPQPQQQQQGSRDIRGINELIRQESAFVEDLLHQVRKVIVGQDSMVERIVIGLLTGGHVLMEGVPGLAKTLAAKTVAASLNLDFKRIQFTPDLLPADVLGTMIYSPQSGGFTTKKGPIFTNLVLADEINRAPAKVQSALLEAMQERQVTLGDTTHKLNDPFLVIATQNPIEQEGTYQLPEAQIDRFMLMIKVDYPTRDEERLIMDRMTSGAEQKVERVVSVESLLKARKIINDVYVDDKIRDYIVDVVIATRNPENYGLASIKNYIQYGASPRATIFLNMAAKAHAFLRHRGYVTPEDVKAVAMDVLRHRVILTFEAEADEVTSEQIVRRVFEAVEVP